MSARLVGLPFGALKKQSVSTTIAFPRAVQFDQLSFSSKVAAGVLVTGIDLGPEIPLLAYPTPGGAFDAHDEAEDSGALGGGVHTTLTVTVQRVPPRMRPVVHVKGRGRPTRVHEVPSHRVSRKTIVSGVVLVTAPVSCVGSETELLDLLTSAVVGRADLEEDDPCS